MTDYINKLNSPDVLDRLSALENIKRMIDSGTHPACEATKYVNNHIHTTYSFSPYSPSKAVYMAYMAGLSTAGIMDHDSLAGAREFIHTGEIMGIATTIGIECRVKMPESFKERSINNCDQKGVAYIALHGIPHGEIDRVSSFYKPFSAERNKRNIKMTSRINEVLQPYGVEISYEDDIMPLSLYSEGGSITERHIMFALSRALIKKLGKGQAVVDFLREMCIVPSEKIQAYLLDISNPYYEYDLLGVLKSDILEKFYIDADAECPYVSDAVSLARETGAICAYAYLGDVTDSVTGDKKAQKFEDDYLDELFMTLKEIGFNAVTYMPSRNTKQQLERIKSLCEEHGFFQISGEDINSPRQQFICKQLDDPDFECLIDYTWALIGHEKAASQLKENGMFSQNVINKYPALDDRVMRYAEIGRDKMSGSCSGKHSSSL